jgi:predicted Zn-dependent protease
MSIFSFAAVRGRPRWLPFLLIVCSLLSAGARAEDQVALPEFGDVSGGLLTPTEEKRIGKAFMRSVRASMPVITDPEMSEYIQSIGQKLVSGSDNPSGSFTFFLIEDPVINAFAGPGGYIGVFTGLVLATETESELASVLAHEIAHVTQKHLYRAFDAASRMALPNAAMMVAAILLGAATQSSAGVAAATGVQAAQAQSQINYTRSNEREADDVGIRTLANSGFEPQAMPVFFERMAKATRVYATNVPEYLLTHPVTTNRIADSRGRADAYPYRQSKEDIRYHLLRARLRVAAIKNDQEAVELFAKALKDGRYRNEAAERYGYAIALARARRYQEAREQLTILMKQDPERIAYIILSAKIDIATDKTLKALQDLDTALLLYPGNYPLTMVYAQTLLRADKPKAALKLLSDHIRVRHEDNPELYKLMAQAATEAGKTAEGHRYMAEYYYQMGLAKPAAEQLEIALRDKDLDFYQSAQMQARLKEFQDEIEALEKMK